MEAHTSIGWKLTSASNGLSDFHGCTFTFQSMETFFTFFARFLTPPHFSPPIHLYPVHHNSHPTYPFHPLPKRSNFYFTSIPPSFITQKSQPFPQSCAAVCPPANGYHLNFRLPLYLLSHTHALVPIIRIICSANTGRNFSGTHGPFIYSTIARTSLGIGINTY